MAYLRELNTLSVLLRLTLAALCGGIIGIDREHKRRPAGFRTYMLVCLGAALTMCLSQYEDLLLRTVWADTLQVLGIRTDVSRFGAQVINGIGFLGIGTILVTGQREVKGLTTAAGLWASACMGLAIGAGFYECMLLGFGAIFLSIKLFSFIECYTLSASRYVDLYIEFISLDRLGEFIHLLKGMNIRIFDVEILRTGEKQYPNHPCVIFCLRFQPHQTHRQVLQELYRFSDVFCINEL